MAKFSDTQFSAFAGATAPRAPAAEATAENAAAPGGELVDEIGAARPAEGEPATEPAVDVAEAEPAAADAGEAAAQPVADVPKAKKAGAAKKAVQPPAAGAPVKGSGVTPVRRQAARGGRTGRAGGTAPEAAEAPAASPPVAPSGYAERGAPVAFTPPASTAVPKRVLNTARGLGLQWVAVNMRALEIRGEYDQACDEVRALCEAMGLPAAAVEAALLEMGASIGAPVAAPVAPAD